MAPVLEKRLRMNSVLPFLTLVCIAVFFICRARALHLRAEGQMMRASANHWGWYGVLQVLIPTALFSVLIWALELYFFNSAIKSLGANLFETPADLQLLRENITASLNRDLPALVSQGLMGLLKSVISYWSGGFQTVTYHLNNIQTIDHPELVLNALNLKMQFSTVLLLGVCVISAIFSYRACGKVTIEFNARDRVELVIISVLGASSVVAILTTVGIVVSLLSETLNFAQMHPFSDFLFGTVWSPQFHAGEVEGYGSDLGVLPLLWGTLYISFVALAFSVPIGLFAAIYLSEYATQRFRAITKPMLELLAGIPTIVYGLFALLTVGPMLRDSFTQPLGLGSNSDSVLAAGLVMGIMLIPFVSSLSDDIINAVPQSLRDGSYGLGATQSETVKKVIIPAALPGIIGAVLLASSRAIGETMIVVLGAGAAAKLSLNPLEGMATITAKIVNQLTGDTEFESPETLVAFALGLTLFMITLCLNVLALYIVRKYREEYE